MNIKAGFIDFLLKLGIFASLVNIINYAYLLYIHFMPDAYEACGIWQGSCDIVNKSSYSELLGIPVALLGIGWMFMHLVFFIYMKFLLNNVGRVFYLLKKTLLFTSLFGVSFGLYLIFIQAVVLKAWCIYCLFSDVILFVIFLISLGLNLINTNSKNK